MDGLLASFGPAFTAVALTALMGALACVVLAAPPLPERIEPYPVVADIEFAEGPTFDQKGNLYFVNYIRNGTIGRKTPDGTVSVWCETGGQANGLKADAEGYLIAADYGGKRILRIHPDGRQIQVLADQYDGQPFLGPNDVCLDLEGNIYFSDPTGSGRDKPIGAVYRIDIRDRRCRKLDVGLAFPNGLAVSPDQQRFFLAESGTNRLLVYDLTPAGEIANRRVARQFETDTLDGIICDEFGRLWIARWTNRTVDVVSPEGELLQSYPAGGDWVTNLCWWGTQLFVTVAGEHSIHRFEVGVRAAPQGPGWV
ncbi:MAG: SMP-30/gluconolactonase/LRE family protein [Armatimonadetes bacterium]|nr:SMP-30/gluconolactonase/LRE family protein [Armatimonadota bacterium]